MNTTVTSSASETERIVERSPASSGVFEFVPQLQCQLCGNDRKKPFDSIRHYKEKKFEWRHLRFDYKICDCCGFVFMDPMPSEESYQRFYRDYYWSIQTSALVGNEFSHGLRNREAVAAGERNSVHNLRSRRIPRIASTLGKAKIEVNERTRVLEVGCAWGTNLAFLHENFGAQVFAVEPSQQAIEHMQRDFPFIKIVGRTAEDLYENKQLDNQFDLVIYSHCLEMIVDQNRILATTHRLLAPQGVVYVDTPNLFWQRALNPTHPYVYSPSTLCRYLRKHNLTIQHVQCCAPPALNVVEALLTFLREGDVYLTVIARKNPLDAVVNDEDTTMSSEEIMRRRQIGQRVVAVTQLPPKLLNWAILSPLKRVKRLFIPSKLNQEAPCAG